MRCRSLVLVAAFLFSVAALFAAPSIALAEEDAAVEAVRALIAGADGDARARAEEVLKADPSAAVRALLSATKTKVASGVLVVPQRMPESRVALPAPAPADDDELVVQLYDVGDLTQGKLTIEALAARLRTLVGEGSSVTATETGAIVLRARSAGREATRQFLDRARRADSTLYSIDARILVAPMTATVGTQVMRARPGEVVELEDPLARVEEWVRGGDVQILASPTVSCFSGQTGAVQVGRQISFVADFDVEVATTAFIADPVIDVVWDGVLAEFTAWSNTDDQIQLSLEIAVSDVEEPMQTFQTSLGALAQPVTIQIPSYVKTEIRRSLTVADGGSALVRLADGPDTRRLLLLSVRTMNLLEEARADDD